jgi:N-ethylmaleimide reductase
MKRAGRLVAAMVLQDNPARTGALPLFQPYWLGPLHLSNRMVMAPMTRSRAIDDGVPNPLAATYYAQRAGAGLIVTEATHATPGGGSYRSPGIHSAQQVAAWRTVVDAVHRAGGKIFVQLWHTGRASHPDLRDGAQTVAPSPIPSGGDTRVGDALRKPRMTPRALDIGEIAQIVDDFRRGAQNAMAAGFDGVELHGANGYLLDQFTRDATNQRSDAYGGSVANRVRFPLEVTRAVIEAIGAERVGYRISPLNPFNAMSDSDPVGTFSYLTDQLNELGIVYLHVVDPANADPRMTPVLRPRFARTYIVNTGFTLEAANRAIETDEADLVAFGVPFLANPDLPPRFRANAPLNAANHATFYSDGAAGYVDYPPLVV